MSIEDRVTNIEKLLAEIGLTLARKCKDCSGVGSVTDKEYYHEEKSCQQCNSLRKAIRNIDYYKP